MLRWLFFATFLIYLVHESVAVPCPFSKNNCKCSGNSVITKKFNYAICQLDSNPSSFLKFDSTVNEYTITGSLTIVGDFDWYKLRIPAQSFVAFKYIGNLIIEHKKIVAGDFYSANFDPLAFQGVQITNLSLVNVSIIIPPPEAIVNLGKKWDLEGLFISRCGQTVNISASTFKDFSSLKSLTIGQTPIGAIDDSAFAGLENNLVELSLVQAMLSRFPSKALNKLSKLRKLNLNDNAMVDFPENTFAVFPELEELHLSNNVIRQAITAGALNHLPSKTTTLYLGSNLKAIPTSVLVNAPQVTFLSLDNNIISSVNADDFPTGNKLTYLNLDENPIDQVIGNYSKLAFLQELSLRSTNLDTFDLSALSGMSSLARLALDLNDDLGTAVVSAPDQVPITLKRISITNASLESVDSKCNILLDRPESQLVIDISNNTQLVCDQNLAWMAKHAFCSKRLLINNTECANSQGKLLSTYLKEIVKTPCQAKTAPVINKRRATVIVN